MNRSNNSTLKITTGAMIIAIFAMLLIVNRQTGLFFEEFFVYLLPLPMAVYTALYDWKYGLMVFVGMTAFSFIFGGFTTIFYAVSASLIGLVFGTMVCRKVDPTKMLIIIMVFSAISTIISSVALASLFGYDIDMSLTEMKTMLTTTFEATGNGALMEFYTMDFLKQLFVISMALMGLLEGFIVYRLGLLIMKRLHISVGRAVPLLEFYPPAITGILAMTAFFAGIYGLSKQNPSQYLTGALGHRILLSGVLRNSRCHIIRQEIHYTEQGPYRRPDCPRLPPVRPVSGFSGIWLHHIRSACTAPHTACSAMRYFPQKRRAGRDG